MAASPSTPVPRARFRAKVFLLFIGIAVAVGLAAYLHRLQTSLVSEAKAQAALDSSRPPRPIAEVAEAVRSMKLVTVEIDTKVKVERSETNWRGNVFAAIEVPVRLSYGTDLSKMSVDSFAWSSLLGMGSGKGAYVVRIPRPTRIATEVFSEREAPQVQAGWLRLRSMAGEYYLSQARKDATDEARELVLLPQDAAKVEQVTREQVAALVKSIVGKDGEVQVVYQKDE